MHPETAISFEDQEEMFEINTLKTEKPQQNL